jgi:hypothetical protein
MGVTIDGPTYVYGDNMSMVHNTQRPESVLKKKSNTLCYHAVRESISMGESIIGHVPSETNPSDIFTKAVSGDQKRDHLIGFFCMTLLIEHLIILLDEEVCGSLRFPGFMDSHKHNQMILFLVILFPHRLCH